MADFGESLLTSFLGALQASVSILLTLGYGVAATRVGLYGSRTSKEISKLCAKLFLPCLIFTTVGKELQANRWNEYLPVLAWSFIYAGVSFLIGLLARRTLNLPKWVVPAMCFNNTTSLPLLLTQALATTGILESILPDGMDTNSAVSRAESYFLVNSMVCNTLKFAFGPKLLASDEDLENEENGQDEGEGQQEQDEADEESPLLPSHIRDPAIKAKNRVRDQAANINSKLPGPAQSVTNFMYEIANPTLLGSFFAILVGTIPALHKAFFNPAFEGGIFKSWLTASLKNVGELFTVLQMFIAGHELSASFGTNSDQVRLHKKAFAALFFVRFILWSAISIPLIYLLAIKGSFLNLPSGGGDTDKHSILWFAMMLMPIGPPAISITAVFGLVANGPESKKESMNVSRILALMYMITPVISFAVVAALKTTEAIGKNTSR